MMVPGIGGKAFAPHLYSASHGFAQDRAQGLIRRAHVHRQDEFGGVLGRVDAFQLRQLEDENALFGVSSLYAVVVRRTGEGLQSQPPPRGHPREFVDKVDAPDGGLPAIDLRRARLRQSQ